MSAHLLKLVVPACVLFGVLACTPTVPPIPPPAGSTAPSGASAALAIYYLTSDRGEPRLIREFHRLPVGDGSPAARTRIAVSEMLDGRSAYDPDYSSLWPAGARVRGVSVSGDTVSVDLSGAGANGAGSIGSHQAVQQLVWTVTAASGKPAVRILLDGQRADELWGHVDTRDPVRRGDAVDVLAPVWLISPQHGDTIGGDVTLHVAGIVFEATANYEIRRGSTVVKSGSIQLSPGGPAQGEAKLTVTLSPGVYVIEAFEISANDSSRQHIDNHTVTVK